MSVLRDQLSCLPEPLTPAKGFSWSRQTSPCFSAIFFMISIVSWLCVAGGIGVGVNGGHLMLGRGHLIVLGFGQNPQPPQSLVQILHVCGNPGTDGAEIMIVQLLALRRPVRQIGSGR